MAGELLSELARIDVVDVLELFDKLEEVLLPEAEVLLGSRGVQVLVRLEVERVHKDLPVLEEVAPERYCLTLNPMVLHLQLAVAQEISEQIRLGQLGHFLQVAVVELEVSRILIDELTHTV